MSAAFTFALLVSIHCVSIALAVQYHRAQHVDLGVQYRHPLQTVAAVVRIGEEAVRPEAQSAAPGRERDVRHDPDLLRMRPDRVDERVVGFCSITSSTYQSGKWFWIHVQKVARALAVSLCA